MTPPTASPVGRPSFAGASLGSLCRGQFAAISEGLSLSRSRAVAIWQFLERLLPVLGFDGRPLDATPRWSAIGDDASPFEWSVVPGPAPDIRLLVEAQADPASPQTYWQAATALTRWCAQQPSVDVGRFARVVNLYTPRDAGAYFACWHGFEFVGNGSGDALSPRVKVYLNPAAAGRQFARAVVAETLTRLGFTSARDALAHTLAAFVPLHCSIDLRTESSARIKVYLRVFDRDQLQFVYNTASGTVSGDVDRLCTSLRLPSPWKRPGYCVLHFVDREDARPARSVVNLPMRDPLRDDEQTTQVLTSWLDSLGIDHGPYRAVAAELARLDAQSDPTRSTGRHSYVSFQRDAGQPRVTLYFGAKAFAGTHGWIGVDPVRTWPTPIAAVPTRDT